MNFLLRFVQPDGSVLDVPGVEGETLMRAAINAGVDGIIGECGGCCACGTCHVYLDEGRIDVVPPAGDGEQAILEGVAAERKQCSRLSCQVTVTRRMEGMTVTVPKDQF